MLMNAPRSSSAGTALVRADEGIIRPVTPAINNTFKVIATHSGTTDRFVYQMHIAISHKEATTNSLYLSIRSLKRPMSGMMNNVLIPETINRSGSCCSVTWRLLMAKALPKGIIIKTHTDSNVVEETPMQYSEH